MHTLSIELNDEIFQKLKENGKILHKSKSQIIKDIIEKWFFNIEKESELNNIVGIWNDRFDKIKSSNEIQNEWRKNLWKRY